MEIDTNVGDKDSIVRIGLGAISGLASIAILTNYIDAPEVASPVLGLIAIALLVTGFTNKCALYKALGINTAK